MKFLDMTKSLVNGSGRAQQYFIDFINLLIIRIDDNSPIIGDGVPTIKANKGKFYFDQVAGKLYIKATSVGASDWRQI